MRREFDEFLCGCSFVFRTHCVVGGLSGIAVLTRTHTLYRSSNCMFFPCSSLVCNPNDFLCQLELEAFLCKGEVRRFGFSW